ncbi:MAG: hypothetical protein IKU83_02270, partial [Lachnospiraceae bacterium]|nr:hypothetical protein [Lachnospiraceae bacterium]
FVYIRQDATQSYREVHFYSIGIISELQECSLFLHFFYSTTKSDAFNPFFPKSLEKPLKIS